jgi:hypothetical protein
MEIEHEHGLYLMIKRIEAALEKSEESNLAMADIMYLVE